MMRSSETAGGRIRQMGVAAGLLALALLAGYGMWAGLGAWTAQQTGWQSLPGLSPLPTGTPRPTATPGWWDSPLEAPTWEGPKADP